MYHQHVRNAGAEIKRPTLNETVTNDGKGTKTINVGTEIGVSGEVLREPCRLPDVHYRMWA